MSRSINPMCAFFVPGAKQSPASPLPHRLDESATGYSLAGCSPALPASASPAGFYALLNSRNSQALPQQAWGIFGAGLKKVLAATLVGAVQQFMFSWVRSVGRF